MKILTTLILMAAAVNSFAMTSCNSELKDPRGLPVFSVNIFHTDKVQALVIDLRESVIPKSYICQMTTTVNDDNVLAAYACEGGAMGESKEIGLFVNETELRANYVDAEDENNDLEDLSCEII